MQATRPRGTLIVKSSLIDPPRIDMQHVVVNEIRIQGSRCGAFQPALDMLAREQIRVDDLVTRTMSLDDGREALREAARSANLKIQIAP